jgi:ribose/xylose/arabinose/galactoside ABC-type transport system permease subunit
VTETVAAGGVASARVNAPARAVQALVARTEFQIFVAAAVLALIFSALYPDRFASFSNVENMSRQAAVLLVVAIGQMFALLVGGFDISVGANMGFTSTVAGLVMIDHGLTAGILVGLGAATLVGLTNGLLIAKLGVSPFIATLGMLTFITGLANHLSDGASVFGMPSGLRWFGAADWGPIPSTVGIGVIVIAVVWFVLTRLRLGLYLYGIGGSREASLLAGIPVARYEVAAYTITGLLAGLAGIMLMSRVSIGQASLGQGFELLSIATAVMGGVAIGGGVGRLSGVVMGVALLAVLTTGMDIAELSEFVQAMVTGAVLVAAVVIDRFRGVPLHRFGGLLRSQAGRRDADPRSSVPSTNADGSAVRVE